jgi:SAM-dependent methyltransferase
VPVRQSPPPGCPICGSASTAERLRFGEYSIVRCASCELQFTHPIPDPATLARAYNIDYSVDFEKYVTGRVGDEKLTRLDELLPERGRLLEIGTSFGEWLASARDRGWQVAGVEISDAAARHAREELGLDVLTGEALAAPGAPGSYDAVVMWHVLEHTVDPSAVVARVADLLRPGGVFAVHVPNGASLGNRVGGVWWPWMAPPIHLWYFTPASIRILVERDGFEVVTLEVRRGDGHDPLMNLAIAAAGRAADAWRRLGSGAGEAGIPTGAFVSKGASGPRMFKLTEKVTSTLTGLADGPVRRFEGRGHGDELAVYARRRGAC